ncbi:betaine--homocysteine S-methyltransferase [Falsiroseomonas sp. HW251]|uniref:betaine--homocysteine S-methyltransferase n=1 Tax=Falsiroseomonas sp. HW251 TaxID=3390998 RepID=UPI003D31020D
MLARRLAEVPVLLADGATGTNLFAMGLANGEAPELWLDSHPDRIAALHRAFVEAGADIILTNSFGGNARRLALHGLQHRTRELNRRAAEIAREVADAAGRPVVVAGSVGPTGDLLAPLGPLTEGEATEVFAEQIAGLCEGGADVAWIETMSAPEEMRAAAAAAAQARLPWTLTASFDTAGRTMMGLMPDAFASFAATLPTQPLAIGANCGVGAADLVVSVLGIAGDEPAVPVIAKANAGIPVVLGDSVIYSGTPEIMEVYAHLAMDAGARIVGGCCGTTPAHLAAMRRALDAHATGPRPAIAAIIEALGPLAQPPPTAGAERRASRRRSA